MKARRKFYISTKILCLNTKTSATMSSEVGLGKFERHQQISQPHKHQFWYNNLGLISSRIELQQILCSNA